MPNQYKNKVALADGTVLIDLTGDTVTSSDHIMQGYVGHLANGSQVTGTGRSLDMPMFTIDWEHEVYTCDTPFSLYDNPSPSAIVKEIYGDGTTDYDYTGASYYSEGSTSTQHYYIVFYNGLPAYTILHWGNGVEEGVEVSENVPSVTTLTATQNGTYTDPNERLYSSVTVNVPSSEPNLQAKTNIAPTTTSQTITADSGYDGLSSVQINAMPTGTAGTPTATKGTVSNHSVSVTPSVTNTTGYITGDTKTGTAVTVSASELVSGSQTITQNGTVDVTNLASVTVNVSGGGASSWTKVAETTVTVNTTSTSASDVTTWATGHSELWTSDKWVYVCIRDTAGKRAGYFYGSDQFFLIRTSGTNTQVSGRFNIRCNSSGTYTVSSTTSTTGYGVYADTMYSDGSIRIRKRYSSSSSLTINGTYKVEVYLLNPAGGIPIFE